jgi:hypothetical protein
LTQFLVENIKNVNNFVEIETIMGYERNWLHCLIPVGSWVSAPGAQSHPTAIAGILPDTLSPDPETACRIL